MNTVHQYMADFTFKDALSEEFFDLIPYQRVVINKFLQQGKLVNYALSIERGKIWAIFNANSENEVYQMIKTLPLLKFMEVEVSLLSQLDGQKVQPIFSLN